MASAAKYDALAERARKEAADYEAAERVWLKLSPGQDPEQKQPGIGRAFVSVGGGPYLPVEGSSTGHSKPSDVPPVPDMIIEALTEASEKLNVDALTPSAILTFVRQKYWPTAKSTDVGSTAWRMWKDGRLTRPENGTYGLPSKGNGPHPDLLAAGQDTRSGVV